MLRSPASALVLPGALLLASILAVLWAVPHPDPSQYHHRNHSNADVLERFDIHSRDRSARATFIPLGATLVDFWVKDRAGIWRDIVLGYDNTTEYLTDDRYPYFGAVVGRVANRIANASYTDPTTRETVHLAANVRNRTTLHGGRIGYSRAGWRIAERSDDRIVFSLVDDGAEGFPGTVETIAAYTLSSAPVRLTTSFTARVLTSPDAGGGGGYAPTTPIMLSSHVYWNLDGFQPRPGSAEETAHASAHRLWVDATRAVEMDGDLIPTGRLPRIARSAPLDFWSRAEGYTIGERMDAPAAEGLCGTGCHGIDSALLFSPRPQAPPALASTPDGGEEQEEEPELDPLPVVARLESPSSGIRLAIRTNQPALHVFSTPSAPWGAPAPYGFARKRAHLAPSSAAALGDEAADRRTTTYPRGGAVALECEGLVDAVHRADDWAATEGDAADPWYHPQRPYVWWAEYELSTFD